MFWKPAARLALLPLLAASLFAQGPDTQAAKDDWEEINFEFNSSVLVDGFPSMLRLADLLKTNSSFRVQVEGNTDEIGGKGYNQRLGLARANSVRDFLIKYGAGAGQITVTSAADNKPKTKASKRGYNPTDEGRYMNRRVVLTVSNGQGQRVGDIGGVGDAIRAINNNNNQGGGGGAAGGQNAANRPDCCAETQRKLDDLANKMDRLLNAMNNTADENKKLKDELDGLKKAQDALQAKMDTTSGKVDQTANKVDALPKPPSATEVAKATVDEHERRNPRFESLGMNVGPTSNGDATFTGKGRFFAPIGKNFAFQSEGEYFYSKGQREGQFDFGGVERIGRFQAGLFSSFKHVNLTGDQTGGTLGQAAFTADYIFRWGKVGAFGTKAFMDDALVNRVALTNAAGVILNQTYTERYLRVVDQAGISGTGPLYKNSYFEGDMAYLKSTVAGDRFGGTLRLIFPIERYPMAFTVEGGVNETLLGRGNSGRAVVGVRFGNFIRPKEFFAADHAVPAQIPRVHYEVLTRTVRVGNDAPVADAGPSQSFAAATTVTLDGSKSYDPNGDPITYLWQQEGGPAVALSSPTSAVTTFAAANGQTYAFRLTVKDPSGAFSVARTTVTVGNPSPIIVAFVANPPIINQGQASTLAWQVNNADTVSINNGIGTVVLNGSVMVSPMTSTTYTLTATKGGNVVTQTVTVQVNPAVVVTPLQPKISSFTVSQQFAIAGTTLQLTCSATNATSISLNGVVINAPSATISIQPFVNTPYICIATGAGGLTDQQQLTVNVIPGGLQH